jgi:hypothetical protein
MTRIRTALAIGSMALLGVAGTGSSALATDGGHSPAQPVKVKHSTGHPPKPAKTAECLARNGAKVTKLKDGYRIEVPAEKAAAAVKACAKYLPPGHAPKGDGKLIIQIGSVKKGAARAGDQFVKCLKDHGALPQEAAGESGSKRSDVTEEVIRSGVPEGGTVIEGEDGSTHVVSESGSTTPAKAVKAVKVPEACEKFAPPGAELHTAR